MNSKVISVNINKNKGEIKYPQDSITLKENFGVIGDGHAGTWHKQVSLVDKSSYLKMESIENTKFKYGSFAENITTENIILYELKIGTLIYINETILEVTQIGKKIHPTNFKTMLPKEGIFARVIKGGTIKPGDVITIK